jgi:hypothetical protein
MLKMRAVRDPWWDDGVGARRTRRRRYVTSVVALGLAIGACGMTLAAWIREVGPLAQQILGI